MKQLISVLAILILMVSGCKNQIKQSVVCEKPPMGFNSYDSYLVFLDQETAKKLIDKMSEKYKPFGYDCFTIDAGWYYEYEVDPLTKLPDFSPHNAAVSSNIDEYGLPEPSKVSIIPEKSPDIPPPFPECSNINKITARHAII